MSVVVVAGETFRHEWEDAVRYAGEVVKQVPLAKLSEKSAFVTASNPEIIYSFMYDRKALSIENMENTGFVVSENLLSCYEQDNDIRFRGCFFVMRGDSRQKVLFRDWRNTVWRSGAISTPIRRTMRLFTNSPTCLRKANLCWTPAC